MNRDWVITFTFDVDPSVETMDFWETELDGLDGSVARIPGRGVDVTVYASGDLAMFEAAEKMASEITHVVHVEPIGAEIVGEVEWQRRAEAPTMPELMSAAEIADELGVSRQRVHQLRDTRAFPAPLADLRGGAVWDANAIRKFNQEWERKPGRPKVPTFERSTDGNHRSRATAVRMIKGPESTGRAKERIVVGRRKEMATSRKDASLAGKQLGSKSATKAEKSVAASDLAQAQGAKAKGKGKGKK